MKKEEPELKSNLIWKPIISNFWSFNIFDDLMNYQISDAGGSGFILHVTDCQKEQDLWWLFTQQMVGIFIQFNAPFYWTDSYLLGTNDCIQGTEHECLNFGVGIFTILSVNNELINFTNFIGQRVY